MLKAPLSIPVAKVIDRNGLEVNVGQRNERAFESKKKLNHIRIRPIPIEGVSDKNVQRRLGDGVLIELTVKSNISCRLTKWRLNI